MLDAMCQIFLYADGGPGAIIHLEGVLRVVRDFHDLYMKEWNDWQYLLSVELKVVLNKF